MVGHAPGQADLQNPINRLISLALLTLCATLAGSVRAAAIPDCHAGAVDRAASLAQRWGIEIEGIRLAAAGSMVDFRYRIVDPDKALPLVDRTLTPYLLDQRSGKSVEVPQSTKIGPLRQTVRYGKPPAGRVFFMLFSNPGGLIRPGARVTVIIGDFRAEDLIVE